MGKYSYSCVTNKSLSSESVVKRWITISSWKEQEIYPELRPIKFFDDKWKKMASAAAEEGILLSYHPKFTDLQSLARLDINTPLGILSQDLGIGRTLKDLGETMKEMHEDVERNGAYLH